MHDVILGYLYLSSNCPYTLALREKKALLSYKVLLVRKINLSDFKTADHRILRDINEVIVLNMIRERHPIPRVRIAEITGLEEGTISRIMHRFLRKGFVYESGVGASTPAGWQELQDSLPAYSQFKSMSLTLYEYTGVKMHIKMHPGLLD